MRGIDTKPKRGPAARNATRSQQDERSFFSSARSQWNLTLMRPNSSVWISSPAGPVTTAVWMPCTTGRGVARSGLNCCLSGIAEKLQRKLEPSPSPDSSGGSM